MSTLLEKWRETAYSQEADRASLQKFWGTYFQIEKGIYEKLLTNPDEEVRGTVKELATVGQHFHRRKEKRIIQRTEEFPYRTCRTEGISK